MQQGLLNLFVFWFEVVGFEDFAAFFDDVEAVDVEVFECVDLAGGPANLELVDFFGFAETACDFA